jgi:hypothetical protein
MTKRVREPVTVTTAGTAEPVAFRWRTSSYRVTAILGHWREDAAYWSGGGVEVPQRDLWRVEAAERRGGAADVPGVYELVQEADAWRLDRVWD